MGYICNEKSKGWYVLMAVVRDVCWRQNTIVMWEVKCGNEGKLGKIT